MIQPRHCIGPLAIALALFACGEPSTPVEDGTGGASEGSGGGFATVVGSGGFEGCATKTIESRRVPVQMYIMFDKSGSMLEDQKWAGATAALIAFFQDEDSAGLSVALRFFPDDDPVAGCTESACSEAACAAPLVPLGELNALPAHSDPQQAALVAAVQSRQPGGQTPMYPALAGAEAWALDHLEGDSETVVVLVTDGEPNGCDTSIANIASLAQSAYLAGGVLTYAIGMDGANLAQLDQIASAGGTGSAYVVGKGTVHKDLVAAFEDIGTAPLECTLGLPSPENAGAEVDPSAVNVSFTPKDAAPEVIPQVGSAADCGGAEGWHYDDAALPTAIELCPASCSRVQADKGGTLEIVLGCATIVK